MSLRTRLSLALGLTVALSLTGPVAHVAIGPFDWSVTGGHLVVAGGLFAAGTALAWGVVGRFQDPAQTFRKGVAFALVLTVPGLVVLGGLLLLFGDWVAAAPVVFGGVLAALPAFWVGFVADRAVLARERGDEAVQFTARKRPASSRRRALAGAGFAGAALWTGLMAVEGGGNLLPFPVLLGLAQLPQLLGHRRTRTYEITEAGLVAWTGHLDWENFDGVAVTDEAIVLQGTVWPFGELAWQRESVEDDDEVIAALERHLPRVAADRERDQPTPLDNLRQALGS